MGIDVPEWILVQYQTLQARRTRHVGRFDFQRAWRGRMRGSQLREVGHVEEVLRTPLLAQVARQLRDMLEGKSSRKGSINTKIDVVIHGMAREIQEQETT